MPNDQHDSRLAPREVRCEIYSPCWLDHYELSSLYLLLSEEQQKSKAEHPVNSATSPRIIASRAQVCPCARRSATRSSNVLTHSSEPKTRIICTRRAAQARLKKRRAGQSRTRTTIGISPARRKCAPSSKALKTTGSSRSAFIKPIYSSI
jgi:hypothetical protein